MKLKAKEQMYQTLSEKVWRHPIKIKVDSIGFIF
jgi:hypothetical protein